MVFKACSPVSSLLRVCVLHRADRNSSTLGALATSSILWSLRKFFSCLSHSSSLQFRPSLGWCLDLLCELISSLYSHPFNNLRAQLVFLLMGPEQLPVTPSSVESLHPVCSHRPLPGT